MTTELNKKARIRYLLNEEGRKKSLLSGGNGKELQEIECNATPEIIELARVDEDGNIYLDIGAEIYDEFVFYSIVVDYKLENSWPSCVVVEEVRGKKRFNEPQTVEQLIEWEKNRLKHIKEKKAVLEEQKKVLEKEYEEKERIKNEQRQREAEELEKKKREEEEKIRQEKEQIMKERKAWIEQYGSEKLKLALELGYECEKDYVYERAKKEFPDFTLDYFDNGCWEKTDNPSFEALKEVKELVDKGYNAYVAEIETFPYDEDNDSGDDNNDVEGEAIVISGYLGKYDLVKLVQ